MQRVGLVVHRHKQCLENWTEIDRRARENKDDKERRRLGLI